MAINTAPPKPKPSGDAGITGLCACTMKALQPIAHMDPEWAFEDRGEYTQTQPFIFVPEPTRPSALQRIEFGVDDAAECTGRGPNTLDIA